MLPALARQRAEEEAKALLEKEEADRQEQLAEQKRQEMMRLQRMELEVRADEAATQREVMKGQLRLREMGGLASLPSPKKVFGGASLEELTDEDS